MSLIACWLKKVTSAATAVPPKVTDVTEQPLSSKLPTQAVPGKLCSQPDTFVKKNFQSMFAENSVRIFCQFY